MTSDDDVRWRVILQRVYDPQLCGWETARRLWGLMYETLSANEPSVPSPRISPRPECGTSQGKR